jgi:hypothetical protein
MIKSISTVNENGKKIFMSQLDDDKKIFHSKNGEIAICIPDIRKKKDYKSSFYNKEQDIRLRKFLKK